MLKDLTYSRTRMLKTSPHLLQVCLAVFALLIAGAVSTKADLSDPTLSVYYGFDGNGDTVEDGSI